MSTTLISRRRNQRRSERPGRSVRICIVVYGLAAVALGVLVIARVHDVPGHRPIPWLVMAAVFVVTDFMEMRFPHEGQSLRLDLLSVPVAVGAVFTPPGGLLLAVTLSIAFTSLLRRDPPERATFNVVNHLAGAALARLVLAATLGGASPVGPRAVVAVALTCLTFELVTDLAVIGAVTTSAGWPGLTYLRGVAGHFLLILPLSAVMAVITVTVTYVETWGMALMAAAAVALGLWYRSANQAWARYANLQQLYGFTVRLSELSDTDDIITVTLQESRRVLHVEHVELRLPDDLGGIRCVLEADGSLGREFGRPSALEAEIAAGHRPLLVPRNQQRRMPAGYDLRDLMAVPVNLGDCGTAVMIVANFEVEDETFDTEDLRFFEAFAASLGTALTSSQRLDRLRLEVAAREHQALHDSLTGLANRTLFGQWVAAALEQRQSHENVAIMLMDLDGFKDINDTLGHHTGDAILKEVGGRVLGVIGPHRRAARLGGDEFAFVLPTNGGEEEALEVAHAILGAVSHPVAVDGLMLELRASLGVAIAPHHGLDPASLLRRADVAMYAAKTSRRGVVAYDHEIDQHAKRRLILATELRRAMGANQLELWYQPVADMRTGDIVSLEALLRWRHNVHGSISPNEFIPVAEQSGLIEPLTWWVTASALHELAWWRREGYELGMAVNISARSLLDPEIVVRLGQMLADAGTPASQLTLEITESLMMADPDRAERVLQSLAGLGVRIAIDDFGTGYSSLSRLTRLPVHTVKVDRSFVASMHNDDGDEAIVRATIELARNLGHQVIAEGVERQRTWDRLVQLGCDQVQGHLLAPAMPSDVCRRWVKAHQSPRMASISELRQVQGA
ncbi:MAG: EAL domain-containing protein [Acidimicrobiales bacterium]|nr:EAL domain-containing protein [Acidimicrobiales bacterium]